MQQPIGLYIRQLRRQRSLTQSELGETHFSKSYVSAVERGTISPSYEALRFFAGQLEQSVDDFERIIQKSEKDKQILPPPISTFPQTTPFQQAYKEIVDLLHVVLDGTEFYRGLSIETLPTLSNELLTELPDATQARYFFLQGIIALEKKAIPPH